MPSQSGITLLLGDKESLKTERKGKICVSLWEIRWENLEGLRKSIHIILIKKPFPGKCPQLRWAQQWCNSHLLQGTSWCMEKGFVWVVCASTIFTAETSFTKKNWSFSSIFTIWPLTTKHDFWQKIHEVGWHKLQEG